MIVCHPGEPTRRLRVYLATTRQGSLWWPSSWRLRCRERSEYKSGEAIYKLDIQIHNDTIGQLKEKPDCCWMITGIIIDNWYIMGKIPHNTINRSLVIEGFSEKRKTTMIAL